MGKSPFTMPGSGFYGKGNQSVSPGKYTESPAKDTPHTTTDDHPAHEDDTLRGSKKERVVEMHKKHAGKPGFQAFVEKTFGGPTTIEGGKSVTTRPATEEEVEELG